MSPGKLQRELKKRQPFQSLAQEAILNLARTSDLIDLQFERLFRSFALTGSQYNVLRILRGEGNPLPILEIASRTITVVPGITGLIDRLEKNGHVLRTRSEQDRRVVYVSIKPAALELLARIDEPVARLHNEVARTLTESELAELSRLLEKLRNGHSLAEK